jgi:hypothetical protein
VPEGDGDGNPRHEDKRHRGRDYETQSMRLWTCRNLRMAAGHDPPVLFASPEDMPIVNDL